MPKVYTDIVARDRTEAGRKAAERGFQGFSKRTALAGEKSGLGRLGKQVEGLSRFKGLSLGFDSAGRSLTAIGRVSGEVAEGVGGATARMLAFGAAGESSLGMVAAGAGVAAGTVAGLTAVVVGLGVATYVLGEKWARTGAEIDRTSRTIGVSAAELQAARAAGERFGVTADSVTASVEGLASTLYDAKYGANNLALGALNQLGVKLKQTKDGAVDVNQAMLDIADAIARQKDPGTQRKLASIFGMSAMLPALRQGSTALKREGADYAGSGAMLSDEEVARSSEVNRKTVTVRQHLSAIEKTAGVAAEQVTGAATDAFLTPGGLKGFADQARGVVDHGVSALSDGAKGLARSGAQAGAALERGGAEAGRALKDAVAAAAGLSNNPAGQMMSFLQRIGFSAAQAKGMTAGAFAESGLRADAVNPKSGAFGIGQWLGGRKKELERRYGSHPTFDQQLEFMGWELTHSEAAAGGAMRNAETPTDALDAYVRRFMRPAPGAETSGDLDRGRAFLQRRMQSGDEAVFAQNDQGDASVVQPPPAQSPTQPPARAQVEIVLKNAPPGTVARATGGRDVDLTVQVKRSMEGA